MSIPLSDQLKCVRREIAFRERVYARRVADRKMTQAQADREIATMKAVAETLAPLARAEDLPL